MNAPINKGSESRKQMRRGVDILRDPLLNKGSAFTAEEREALGLRGLFPPHISTQEEQVARFMRSLQRLPDALEKLAGLLETH